ncbi:hypothetical protein ABZ934_12520 [Streptomyces sp. NPDC046557]|uniref:hypothetical protein n=1 Tax=Streptomyces sp. NPDC046557 TaxID=3155372 RepID=UPI0033D5773E
MKLTPRLPGALLLALTAFVLPAAIAAPALADAPPFGEITARAHRHTAAQISGFLIGFYGHHGPSAHDRRHRVSQQLKDKQKNYPDSDVLLCARSKPNRITVGPATVAQNAGVGWATVTTHWDGGATDTFTAYVRLDSRPIRVDDVICAG